MVTITLWSALIVVLVIVAIIISRQAHLREIIGPRPGGERVNRGPTVGALLVAQEEVPHSSHERRSDGDDCGGGGDNMTVFGDRHGDSSLQ